MKYNQEFGKKGEDLALQFLLDNGYRLAARNWRFGRAEVDLIAWSAEGILVFVEVKTRKHDRFGQPEEAVSLKKQNLLYEAAVEYMYQQQYEGEIRFDIIAVVIYEQNPPAIEHFPDAFFPTW